MLAVLVALVLLQPPDPPPSSPPAPIVKLPADLAVPPGKMLRLSADTTGRLVAWAVVGDDAELVAFADGKQAVFVAAAPGKFTVLAWSASGDVPGPAARCAVTVGGPAPAPAPPTPPAPTPAPPAPPAPQSQLARELQALVVADATADRAAVRRLAQVYRDGAPLALAADTLTPAHLADKLRAAVRANFPANALAGVRTRLAQELARRILADPDRALDPATRRLAADLFVELSQALDAASEAK